MFAFTEAFVRTFSYFSDQQRLVYVPPMANLTFYLYPGHIVYIQPV